VRDRSTRIGLVSALVAYVLWGAFPLFWRLLGHVPPLELVCHRVLWSSVLLLVAIPLLRRFGGELGNEIAGGSREIPSSVRTAQRSRLVHVGTAAAAAIVISINWLSFIWAVNQDRVLEAALGYYISPLFSVGLGVLVLRERLSRWQWGAILVALVGVISIASASRSLPWVSLLLAASFATYGLIKKNTSVSPLIGLLLENVILTLPSVGYLIWLSRSGSGTLGNVAPSTDLLLVLGGVVTVPPLMLFALAARRVPLATVGMLQYISPTLQFLLGIQVVGERLNGPGWLGFLCVWIGCLLYVLGTRKALTPTVAHDNRLPDRSGQGLKSD